ncbi:MAG TPA: serine/threonine-protein kinase [Candidatus Polarisedimenticolia bacterium]|nr:serine/threonine-protein kinase [Candidatus Polarisedimenticolia bacterium]
MAPEKFGIWEVEAKVGEGSFGIVYRCRDPFLKKYIAIKALKGHLLTPDDPTTLSDFFKEAELLAHFNHPAFTHIYYLNPEPPWIAMEFLEGETLENVLQRKEQVGLDRIARIFQMVCDGLHHIHAQVEERYRTVHRDLKPGNLLLLRDGSVKIIDFGVAKASIGDPTIVGVVKGTPLYMSPEHMGGTVDSRSDLWSLAVILFETLTGGKPYPDPDPSQAWSYAKLRRFEHSILNDRYAALPRTMPPYLKDTLTAFFDRVFQLDKEKRFQSALEFRSALDKIVEQTSRHAAPGEVLLPPLSEVDLLLYQAGDLFDSGSFGSARELYESVLGLDPDNEEAHHWLLRIEDRTREAPAAVAAPAVPPGPPLPAEDVALLRRVLRRPALNLPADLMPRLHELLQRIDTHRPEDREALRGELSDAGGSVAKALQARVTREAEEARSTLQRLQPIDPQAAQKGSAEVERIAGAVASGDAVALAAMAVKLGETRRHAEYALGDALSWLRGEAMGVASHLELLLAAHEGDAASLSQGLQDDGYRALAALQAPAASEEPAGVRDDLRAAAAAVDRLRQGAAAERLERQRDRLRKAGAALPKALPDALAASLRLTELRDQTARLVAEALRWDDPRRLAEVAALLEDLNESAGRIEAALPPPQPETPAPQAAVPAPARKEAPPEPRVQAPSQAPSRKEAPAPAARAPVPARREAPQPRAVRERTERKPRPDAGRRGVLWWGAAGAVALAAVIVVIWMIRPSPPVPQADGILIVDALPWGNLREIVDLDRSAPVPLSEKTTTPYRLSLPPGRYRVTVSNPDFGEVSVETEVRDSEVRNLGVRLPQFDVEKLLKEF